MHTSLVRMHACVQAQGATYISGGAHTRLQVHTRAGIGVWVAWWIFFFSSFFSVPGKIHHFLFL